MWRRLCVDVDVDGTLLGASVEIYSDSQLVKDVVLVMEDGWVEGRTLTEAITSLEETGFLQPPLRLSSLE